MSTLKPEHRRPLEAQQSGGKGWGVRGGALALLSTREPSASQSHWRGRGGDSLSVKDLSIGATIYTACEMISSASSYTHWGVWGLQYDVYKSTQSCISLFLQMGKRLYRFIYQISQSQWYSRTQTKSLPSKADTLEDRQQTSLINYRVSRRHHALWRKSFVAARAWWGVWGWRWGQVNRTISEHLPVEGCTAAGSGRWERVVCGGEWASRGNSQCKGPEEEVCLECPGNSEAARMCEEKQVRESVDEESGAPGAGTCWPL